LQRGEIVGQPTVPHQRDLQRAVVWSDVRWFVDGVDDFLGRGAGGLVPAQCCFAATTGGFVGAAFGDWITVDGHEFVHHFRGRRPGTGHHRGADTVGVHRFGPQCRDGVFVEVPGDDHPGVDCTECVELFPCLPCEYPDIAGIDAYRAELPPGDMYGRVDTGTDVVGVDHDRGVRPTVFDLGAERFLL